MKIAVAGGTGPIGRGVAEGYRHASPDGEAVATGSPLSGPDVLITGPTFEEWLDAGEHVQA